MHVLLYSSAFFPAVGGVESVSLSLAHNIVAAGHACTVVTETPAGDGPAAAFPFAVARAPGRRRRLELARAADIVHSNGASLAMFPYAKLARRPFLWTHSGYQMVTVDGMGWLDGAPAPMTPLASLALHARKRGFKTAGIEAVKLGLRRAVGHFVDKNVAVSKWVAMRQPLPRQIVIYNPFSLERFKAVAAASKTPRHDFVYVGRLVSEKGVARLLESLALVNGSRAGRRATLLVVGDGVARDELVARAASLGVAADVTFAGRRLGDELLASIADGAIAVMPTECEETMGGVALEMLAAGKPLIVSERGGMAECVGDAAWTVPNGDAPALAARMAELLDDEPLRRSKVARAPEVVARFDEARLARQYVDLYEELLAARA